MRKWIIEYFLADKADEISLPQELQFYGVVSMPVIIFIIIMILV